MMLQMDYVVPHQVFKSYRFGLGDSFESYLLQRVQSTRGINLRFVRVGHHVEQVKIVRAPQLHEPRPCRLLIMIRLNPTILIVTGEKQIILELSEHEPRMIVGG